MNASFSESVKILDKILSVNLSISIWSGVKKLSREDLGGAELPPDDLASLGSKRICNPQELRVFGTLRQRAYSMLDRYGVRFLGGWAIPEDSSERIAEKLRALRKEFEEAKEAFLLSYDDAVEEWIVAHPDWADIIRSSAVGVDYVRPRIQFRWQFFKVETPSVASDELDTEIGGLGNQLYKEVSQSAEDILRNFGEREELSQRSLNSLKVIKNKVLGLAFLDYGANALVDLIDAALQLCPTSGPISGAPLVCIKGILNMMRVPSVLLLQVQRVIDDNSPKSLLNELLGTVTDTTLPIEQLELSVEPQFIPSDPELEDLLSTVPVAEGNVIPVSSTSTIPQDDCGLW